MNKLDMKTLDNSADNVDKIGQLFPNVVTEKEDETGQKVKAVDFELLKQLLSKELVEDDNERYRLDWPGKKASLLKANTPITKTLRPDRESSVNFDTTQNMYIEGDNFEVLKILQESYLNKIKMIYIDPPYNTGRDFVYRDNLTISKEDYDDEIGIEDEEGGKLFRNLDTNGRFHSDWLSMIYERLLVARDLLREDGVIFISIDDNEVINLRKICDEIFGENNFVESLVWKKRATPPNDRNIGRIHEYILCYSKSEKLSLGLLERDQKSIDRYSNPDNDPRGPWVASDLSANGKGGRLVQSCIYPILNPVLNKEFPPSEGRCWLFNKEKMDSFISEGRIAFRENTGSPYLKRYLNEVRQGLTLPTILNDFGYSSTSAAEADILFEKKGIFEYAKPTLLIKSLIKVGAKDKDDLILDFFAGSSTTADAVMQLNVEDKGDRKFIMVQIPEKVDEKSEAYKSGYKTISEIGRERIQRAGKKILKENSEKLAQRETPLDVGFRVFKTDSTIMEDVYYHPSILSQDSLSGLADNIKSDRTPEDILTQVMLDLGLTLNLPIEKKSIKGQDVFFVADNALVACFDKDISFDVIDEIIKSQPLRVVFRDASFKDDKDRINLETKFKQGSPETSINVL